MKHRLITLALIVALVACSSASKFRATDNGAFGKTVTAKFVEQNGPLLLTFDERGHWQAIESSATAPVSNNAAEGLELAFKIATMRAKRNLVEFLSNDVKSTKSIQTISKTYLKHLAQTDSGNATDTGNDEEEQNNNRQAAREVRQRANKLAMIVSERIDDNSQQIIKGVLVVSRKFSDDGTHVSVTIRVTQSGIRTADIMRMQMENR